MGQGVALMATRPSFGEPSTTPGVDKDGNFSQALAAWVSRITVIGQAAQQHGPTANRPTAVLWIGRRYYDTDLGLPVFVDSVGPPVVWHDAAGNPV